MRNLLSAAKVLLLVPLLFFCSPKTSQQTAGKADKAGEIKVDTLNKSAPGDLNQRIIHNSADQNTVDSLKKIREKRKYYGY
ncbi:MAG: hypothetical protein NTW31_00490 [Bacteroidetes bacterium]|nr:hypothetical protein [Bacteroidota bacterium]